MPRYIDSEKLKEQFKSYICVGNKPFVEGVEYYRKIVLEVIEKAPVADVAEVRRGKWIYGRYGGMWPAGYKKPDQYCSVCGTWSIVESQYCPSCGAMMEEHYEAD